MTSPSSQIEVISNPRPDPDASADNVTSRLRGRHAELNKRGGDFRTRILKLEDELQAAADVNAQLRQDLERARANGARLSERTGLCAQLRADVKIRDDWLKGWRQGCETLQADATTARVNFERRLAEERATVEHFEERHLELSGNLSTLNLANGNLQAEVTAAQDQRDALRAQLDRAERALRHSVRARTTLANDLIAARAQLVCAQSELLDQRSEVIDLQRRLLPAEPLPSTDDTASSTASLRLHFDGQSLAGAGTGSESPAASQHGSPRLSPVADSAAYRTSVSPVSAIPLDSPGDLASLLIRDPGADISSLLIIGEPVSPGDTPLFEDWADSGPVASNLSPPHSASGPELGLFNSDSPRAIGATSPADPRSFSLPPSP